MIIYDERMPQFPFYPFIIHIFAYNEDYIIIKAKR